MATMIDSAAAIGIGNLVVMDAGDGSGMFAATIRDITSGYHAGLGIEVTFVTVQDADGFSCRITLDELRQAQRTAEQVQFTAHLQGADTRH